MRIFGWEVYQLHRGKAHYDEPFQYHEGGTEHRKDRLPEEPDSADMERFG